MDTDSLIACAECDLLHHLRPLPPGARAVCTRCGALLYRGTGHAFEQVVALCLTGLILYALALFQPLLVMRMQGQLREATLTTGIWALWGQGWRGLAVLVALTSALLPPLYLLGLAYVLLPLRFHLRLWRQAWVFRTVETLRNWAMVEVFLLGILVAYVKLSDMAQVIPGPALYALGGATLTTALALTLLEPSEVWERLA